MKLNEIFYEENYTQACEFVSQNNGTMITEIEADENGRRFQIVEIPKPTYKELAEQEIKELKQWFDIEYARKEQKYNRLIRKGLLTDDNKDPKQLLSELDEEAEEKRARIQELEEKLTI